LGEVSLCLVAGHESVGGEPTGIHTFTELRNLMQKALGGTRDTHGTETQITQTVAFSAFSAQWSPKSIDAFSGKNSGNGPHRGHNHVHYLHRGRNHVHYLMQFMLVLNLNLN
jgi:hypothetical protein